MTGEEFSKKLRPDLFQVFLLSSPCNIPLNFARHHWFVVNRQGIVSRWEVLFREKGVITSWGHLHKDFLPPHQGIEILPFSDRYFWKSKLMSIIEGGIGSSAEKAANFIEASATAYKYKDTYKLLGPNSNTFAQWVLDNVPEFKVALPMNSFGSGYK